ncbi:MAG: hypothetical protein JO099_03140 [Acidobacteriia bacterium]|nr:hypothetical protein [Terriglobia bacterium]
MISLQTNVNSLVAQENMNVNSMFQSQTIQQLTSGYRINQSGDDAAGLAVANKYRDAIAELTQGVANGSQGVAQLQIMDGGMGNISQILDRLQTLANESATGSFTGSRVTLNNEFQTDIGEIDRQAQSIGLNTGGTFAQNLAVYIGAGTGSQNAANSVVNVNLSNATVDSASLGLTGYVASNTTASGTTYDLGASSVSSVKNILSANGSPSTTTFTFAGPGFADNTTGNSATGNQQQVSISVNLSGVGDVNSLVNNINAAIQSAQANTGGNYAAFKAANIVASIHTDSTGAQQLQFTSANSAFQVTEGDATARALMGNFTGATTALGNNTLVGNTLLTKGAFQLATPATSTTPNTEADLSFSATLQGHQTVTINAIDANGGSHQLSVTLDSLGAVGATATGWADAINAINNALQASNDTTLQKIVAINNNPASESTFVGTVNFISSVKSFTIGVTTASTGGGIAVPTLGSQGQAGVAAALQVGSGAALDISTQLGAQNAITAITNAVNALGTAQAAIGKGQNVLNYAVNLANSEITNFSVVQSDIRDANVAQEAANLSKAQVLQQAAVAAMAQANSAPQAILSLLR